MYASPPLVCVRIQSLIVPHADADKFEKEKGLNYKSNIRSTLYSNLLFEKLEESRWGIVRLDKPPKAKRKRRNRR